MKYDIKNATKNQLIEIIEHNSAEPDALLIELANAERQRYYGNRVYLRGLIEFSNYCKNDCFYCGIRRSNQKISRYRLSPDEIINCCDSGYGLGFRTFVLQSGEDDYFDDKIMTGLIRSIKNKYPNCAVTLSMGEKSEETYERYYQAGADRYLLRHEAASNKLYRSIHPSNLMPENRKDCLYKLKKIGFQTGAGFMVGIPGQTPTELAEDMLFLKDLQPHMVGIGPFIPHHDTRYAKEKAGDLNLCLVMLAMTRLMLPEVLLPSTTALGTIAPNGRELGLMAGGNVVMPNLSPVAVRKDYTLYDNKISTHEEAAENVSDLCERIRKAGFEVDFGRGDHFTCCQA